MSSKLSQLIEKTDRKNNYGNCVVCGKVIVFYRCKYCGPACNFSVLEAAEYLVPPPPESIPDGQEPILILGDKEAHIEYENVGIVKEPQKVIKNYLLIFKSKMNGVGLVNYHIQFVTI
jgi:hypothetical protein